MSEEQREGHFPRFAGPISNSMPDRYREAVGLGPDEPVGRFDTPAFVGKGMRHARATTHADENPTKQEQDVKNNIRAVDSIKGIHDYDSSPILRKGPRAENVDCDDMHLIIAEKLIADLESPEDRGSSTRNTIAGTLRGVRKTARPLHNITAVIDRIDNRLDHPSVSDEDANVLQIKQAHYSDAADSMYRKGMREDFIGEQVDALVEGAFTNWVRTMTNRSSKREKSDAKYGRPSPAGLAKDVVAQGPGSVRDLVGGQGRKPNYDAPTLLRNEIERTVGKDEGGNTKFTPYRPFAPSRKIVGDAGKSSFMGSPGSFVDSNTGLKYSASGNSVGVAGVKDVSSVGVALDPHKQSGSPRSDVSAATKADAARRTDIYKNASYKSIRGESIEQTEQRLLAEMKASVTKLNVKGGPMVADVASDVVAGVQADVEKVVEGLLDEVAAQHHMSSVEPAKRGYVDFTGKR